MGKQLLIRGSKKVTLTEDGMLLHKRAEELVDLMEKTKAELASSDQNISGEIYIGSGETDAISFLAQAAGNLQKKHPTIHYHIYSGDAERVTERLDKLINTTGESELCFRPLHPTLEAGLCIVWKKSQVFSRASNAFLHQLQREMKQAAGAV